MSALDTQIEEITGLVQSGDREALAEALRFLVFVGMFDSQYADELLTD